MSVFVFLSHILFFGILIFTDSSIETNSLPQEGKHIREHKKHASLDHHHHSYYCD
jgi:hypothetical protein